MHLWLSYVQSSHCTMRTEVIEYENDDGIKKKKKKTTKTKTKKKVEEGEV